MCFCYPGWVVNACGGGGGGVSGKLWIRIGKKRNWQEDLGNTPTDRC